MKHIICILLFFILLTNSCRDVDSLVRSIASENRVECEALGIAGVPSKLYRKFERLKQIAPKEKLIQLINHDSLAVIGYSAYALIDKGLIDPSELLERFIDKEENVSTICGCLIGSETLSSLIYHRYWNSRIEYPGQDYDNPKLNDSQALQRMDSIILYSKNPDWLLLARAFDNRIYHEEYRLTIEDWGFIEKNFYALQYIHKNLLPGNEKNLKTALKEFLTRKDIYEIQKEKIIIMLEELEK